MALIYFAPSATQASDSNGNPLSGAIWKFYTVDTLTPVAVYNAAGVSLGTTVTADANGRFVPIYLDAATIYRARLTNGAGTLVGSNDINPYNPAAAGSDGDYLSVGLFTDIDQLDIPENVRLILTSGHTEQGTGPALYYVGLTTDAAVSETVYSTNTANGRPVTLAENIVDFKQVGATGNNLAADAAKIAAFLSGAMKAGDEIHNTPGPAGSIGGAFKYTSGSFEVTKAPFAMTNAPGVVLRSDNTAGQVYPALRIIPQSNTAGGFYATFQGYLSGNNVIITSNTAGKAFFNGSGLAIAGNTSLLTGTHLAADVLSNATGTYAVQVNGANSAQSIGSVGSPVTFLVIYNEARNSYLAGGSFNSNNLSGGGGGYGVEFGTAVGNQVFSMIGTSVDRIVTTGTLGGLKAQGGLGREHLWTTVSRSTIEGFQLSQVSDGFQFHSCVLTSKGDIDLLEGAFNDGVIWGTVVMRDGIKVTNGSKGFVFGAQLEQSGVTTRGPMLDLTCTDYPGILWTLLYNNWGGGTGYRPHIKLGKARGTIIDASYFNICYEVDGVTQAADIKLTRDATNDAGSALPYLTAHDYDTGYVGSWDTYDTLIGYTNRTRGARPRQGMSAYTDVSRLLKFDTNSTAVRMPNRGLWYPAADVLTSLGTSVTVHADGCQLMIEHSGRIAATGGLALGASLALGAALFTIPRWMCPYVNGYASAVLVGTGANADQVISLRINASTGAVTTGVAISSVTHVALRLDNTSWMAVTDPYPTIGP